MSIYFLAMYLCGASFGPLITGRLSDYLARSAAHAAGAAVVGEAYRAIGLHQAMYVIPRDLGGPGAGAVCRIAHYRRRYGAPR